MKIIGNTDSGYLVEALADELMNIMGVSSTYSSGPRADRMKKNLVIGGVLPVNEMFGQLGFLNRAKKDLLKTAQELRKAASLIETASFPEITLPSAD